MVLTATSEPAQTDRIPTVEPHSPPTPPPPAPARPASTQPASAPAADTAPSLAALAAHIGYRISYRNQHQHLVPGSHLLATLLGTPLRVPGTEGVWLPIRPYLNLAGHTIALIRPTYIRTIFATRTSQHTPRTERTGRPSAPAVASQPRRHAWHTPNRHAPTRTRPSIVLRAPRSSPQQTGPTPATTPPP